MSLKDVQPLPLVLFPVYRFFCAASLTGLRSLGCLIHASRVGQRPPLFYHKQLLASAKSQRLKVYWTGFLPIFPMIEAIGS